MASAHCSSPNSSPWTPRILSSELTPFSKPRVTKISFKGKRFQYHSKSKERLIYHSRLIKDFHAIADLVVAIPTIATFLASITIAIGDGVAYLSNLSRFAVNQPRYISELSPLGLSSQFWASGLWSVWGSMGRVCMGRASIFKPHLTSFEDYSTTTY
jgi:hypothetical protein